jgi:hypothetical protein
VGHCVHHFPHLCVQLVYLSMSLHGSLLLALHAITHVPGVTFDLPQCLPIVAVSLSESVVHITGPDSIVDTHPVVR